jgi:regulator of protease activity HflC (stomatin/prohibitin superfamily)
MSTGSVNYESVYGRGRYLLGPDRQFIKYRADSHHVILNNFSVFSSGVGNESIGLLFVIEVDFTYLLIKDRVGSLHKELSASYDSIITNRAKGAIKNEAASVNTTDYFQARQSVESRFRKAIEANWNGTEPLPCRLDQFHLGRINITDSVAVKQLQTRMQNERNEMEASIQKAAIERERTTVEINSIALQTEKLLRTANAEASLLHSRAQAEAAQFVQEAHANGTMNLFRATEFTDQEHMAAFIYIRTLMNRDILSLDVSYLSADNILRTTVV